MSIGRMRLYDDFRGLRKEMAEKLRPASDLEVSSSLLSFRYKLPLSATKD